jgi:hypothetical protein
MEQNTIKQPVSFFNSLPSAFPQDVEKNVNKFYDFPLPTGIRSLVLTF